MKRWSLEAYYTDEKKTEKRIRKTGRIVASFLPYGSLKKWMAGKYIGGKLKIKFFSFKNVWKKLFGGD